eukprot:gene46989-64290_t
MSVACSFALFPAAAAGDVGTVVVVLATAAVRLMCSVLSGRAAADPARRWVGVVGVVSAAMCVVRFLQMQNASLWAVVWQGALLEAVETAATLARPLLHRPLLRHLLHLSRGAGLRAAPWPPAEAAWGTEQRQVLANVVRFEDLYQQMS